MPLLWVLKDKGDISPVYFKGFKSGGSSKSAVWRRIIADIFNTEVVAMAHAEGAAYGGALQARWAFARSTGEHITLEEIAEAWVKADEKTRTAPHRKDVSIYRRLQKLHDRLSKALRPVFKSHRRIIGVV